MRFQLSAVLIFGAVLLQAQAPQAALQTDWVSVTNLPNVDTTGLSAKQKTDALKSMHVENCVCGCNMKVAQCRVLDPACGDSKALASMVVGGVKDGKTADQIHDILINSNLAKARASQNQILSDPVKLAINGRLSKVRRRRRSRSSSSPTSNVLIVHGRSLRWRRF